MPEISINASDNSGTFMAYIAVPEVTPAPAVVMIQEIFGVNEEMRRKCDDLAKHGYIGICPDLFWRLEPGVQLSDKTDAEWEKAFDLMGRFDVDKGVEDLKDTLAYIREHEQSTGKVAAKGYCLGGKLAFLMATRSDADCAIGYYGVGLDELLEEADTITNPLLLHIAEEDEFVPKDAQEKIKEGLKDHPQVTIYSYEGVNHAFARLGGNHYDANAAMKANERTARFLEDNLT